MCLLLLGSSGLLAQQQTALLLAGETLDKQAKATPTRMYIADNRVLVETDDAKKPTIMLYDAEKEEIYLIDHKKKEYYLLDKATMAAMNAQIKQMQDQLQQLPESQRKMIEEQMRKAQGIQEPLTYTKEASDVAVGDWKSTKYTGKSEDQLRHEVFVVPYQELGEEKDKFKALTSLFALFQEQLQQMSSSMPGILSFSANLMPGGEEGLPVKTIYYDPQGKPEITTILSSIEETTLAEDKLTVPENYKQKQFMATAR